MLPVQMMEVSQLLQSSLQSEPIPTTSGLNLHDPPSSPQAINLTKKSHEGRISTSPGESPSNSPLILCNWKLLDEVSVPLLETGICTYPILQAVLPSILLAEVNDEKTIQNLPKLFRIAQMEIEYLLRSQNELVQQLSEANKELTAKKLISALLKNKQSPVYECATCKKTFVSSSFLQSHLRRRHGRQSTPSPRKSPIYKA